MNGWQEITLGEAADIVSGSTPKSSIRELWDGDILWATPTDLSRLNSKFIERTERTISEKGLKSCSARLLPPNSVLFSSRAPIGLVAINKNPMATNQGFKSFVPKADLHADYLYWWLKANREHLQGLGNGATFKEVSKSVVARVSIPLPPLYEQRRIAQILDKADAIRRKRKKVLTLADTLLDSYFEFIQNKYANEARSLKLLDIAEEGKNTFSNGPFGSNLLTSELTDSGVPVIYIRDIKNSRYERVSTACVTHDKAQELSACVVKPGDLLIAKVGDPPGTTAVYPLGEPDAIVTQDVIRLRLHPKVATSEYIKSLLNSEYGKHVLSAITVEATRARFGLGQLKKTEFRMLPLERQIEFSSYALRLTSIRSVLDSQLHDSQRLFASLSQRAFRGEL